MMIFTFVLVIAVLCGVMAYMEIRAKKAEEEHSLDIQVLNDELAIARDHLDYWLKEYYKMKKERDLLKNYGKMYDDLKKENESLRGKE